MEKGKRFLAWLLTVAMVITSVNLGLIETAKAEEIKSELYYKDGIVGTFFGTDGNQISTSDGNNTAGTNTHAPAISGTTWGGGGTNWGSNRFGCLVFQIPTNMELTALKSARVTLRVKRVANLDNWMKIALYETENPVITSGSPETNYAAKNGYNGVESAIWSEETVSNMSNADYPVHFDVTEVVRNVNMENGRLVLRVQVPRAGVEFVSNTPATLTIDATTPTEITVKYVNSAGSEIRDSKTVDACIGSKYTYEPIQEQRGHPDDFGRRFYRAGHHG